MMPMRCPNDGNLLKSTNTSSKCTACYEEDDKKQGRKCDHCNFSFHEECMNLNLPSHHKHTLKLANYYQCHLCHDDEPKVLYRCSQCDFNICIPCARKPLIINQAKAHKHELQQIPIKLSFTCDACGFFSSDYPCICHQCCFITHRKCIFLPRVIYINRHDHRVSHVSSLGPGNWICGICHEPVQGGYVAYSCLICSYVVHSKCATDRYIWDGRELEGKPEEEEEGKPFEVIDQNLIKHFSHEHNLEASLGLQEDKHCYACTISFNSERCYRCTQCDFMLHVACANLPLRKRHLISRRQLNLHVNYSSAKFTYFSCDACERYCTGFKYANYIFGFQIDVRCASITDAFKHESHPHWLFPFKSYESRRKCTVCDSVHEVHLRCIINHGACGGFTLCFKCATLPTQLVRHKYDDHPLSLGYGEGNANSTYCCGVCEEEGFPERGFYWCRDCNSTLHTKCVFTNLLHPRPGYTLKIRDKGTFELLPNNTLSRPTCYECKNHCIGDLVLKSQVDKSVFMCSSCVFPEK